MFAGSRRRAVAANCPVRNDHVRARPSLVMMTRTSALEDKRMPVILAGVRFTSRVGRVADDRAALETPSLTPPEILLEIDCWTSCDRTDPGISAAAIASSNNPHPTTDPARPR